MPHPIALGSTRRRFVSRTCVFLLACGLTGVPLAAATTLHVATNGHDTWSGRRPTPNAARTDGPFASLERARDEVRRLKQSGLPAGAVTVQIAAGLYPRQAALALEAIDSGTPEAPVVYRGAPGGATRLLGGRLLPAAAWRPVSDPAVRARLDPAVRDQVRQLSLREAGLPEPGPEWHDRFKERSGWPELFFAGRRMTLARWPNTGWARIVDVVGGAPHKIHNIPGDKLGRFTYDGDRPSRWVAEPDLWAHGYWFWDWSDGRQRVEAVDPAKRVISLAPPMHYYGYRQKARWYVYNALAELDSPGEWCIDRATWTLYFLPPEPLADHEAGFSQLSEPLFRLTDVSHVTIASLTGEISRGDGVQMTGGRANRVVGCTFRNLGQIGVRVNGGTDHGVQSCDLYHLGAGGINLSGGDRRTLQPAGHFADNNHIHHFAELAHTYQNAIRLDGVGCRMTHNLVHDTVHEALCYSGNDHLVEFNEVHSVCLEADDSGVIHQGRDWTWRGNIIRHNFFHHVLAGHAVSNMGVYLDDMECGTLVYGNVLYRIPRAILVGGGRDVTVQNNLVIDCPTALSIDNRAMNWAGYHVGTTMKSSLDRMPYQSEPWRSRYPKLVGIWSDEPAVPKGNTVRENLMVRSGAFALAPEVARFGTVTNNLHVTDDPGFVAPERLDFRLRDPAAVAARLPGFAPIPFEQIGLRLDTWRTALPAGTPVLNPEPQAFVEELAVRLSPGRGAADPVIHYTLDGRQPTLASPVYTAPLRLTETTTIRALAVPRGGRAQDMSAVASGTFTVQHLGPQGGVYLDGLAAADVTVHGGLKLNSNYAGSGPASLGGRKFAHSLMLCPAASPEGGRGRATFELRGGLAKATVLRATIGIEDSTGQAGSATFAVDVERDGRWVTVYESPVLRGGQQQELRVDVKGGTRLRLRTTDGGDNIHSDHAVWADAKLQ